MIFQIFCWVVSENCLFEKSDHFLGVDKKWLGKSHLEQETNIEEEKWRKFEKTALEGANLSIFYPSKWRPLNSAHRSLEHPQRQH